ncbi:MAG: TIGR01777 family oxidoreductase [Pseudomonadota bacterium]
MKTLVTGCSGLIGNALIEYLFQRGHSIQCLKRNKGSEQNHFWATQLLPTNTENVFDTVIHLAGENVAEGRWTVARKERILKSRVEGTRQLIDYISMLAIKPKVFLCASAIGYYGHSMDEIFNEDSRLGHGFLADVCHHWERQTDRLAAMGVRTVNLRFGMVLSPKGGALHKMIPPFKARLGGMLGNGQQFISWISIRDLVAIIDFIINQPYIQGPVNIVSPIPTNNKILTETLGRVLNRPALLRIPAFLVKLLFGQMAEEMLLCSTRVTPKVLLETDYNFQDQSLEAVLRYCLETNDSPRPVE